MSVGRGRQVRAIGGIAAGDPLRLWLADAIVRSFGGRIEQWGGNPNVTFVMSLRATGESSTSAGDVRLTT
jgi:hypothetical protein